MAVQQSELQPLNNQQQRPITQNSVLQNQEVQQLVNQPSTAPLSTEVQALSPDDEKLINRDIDADARESGFNNLITETTDTVFFQCTQWFLILGFGFLFLIGRLA